MTKRNNSKKVMVKAEYHRLEEVILFSPGEECKYSNRHPPSSQSRGFVDVPKAQKQHQRLKQVLIDLGVKVHDVKDILFDLPLDELIEWASISLQHVPVDKDGYGRRLSLSERRNLRDIRKEIIHKSKQRCEELMNQGKSNKENPYYQDLVKIILEQQARYLWPGNNGCYKSVDTDWALKDLLFQRDNQIITDKGLVQCKMRNDTRRDEVEFMSLIYDYLNIEPLYQVDGDNKRGFLEGGDYIPVEDFAMIGCGLRTDYHGIRQLLQNKKGKGIFGFPEVAVFRYENDRQEMQDMHLDTYLNVVGKNKDGSINALIWEDVYEFDNIVVDVWKKQPSKHYTLEKEDTAIPLKEFLDSKNFNLIKLSYEEQDYYGINVLTVDNNYVICPDDPALSNYYKKLQLNGIKYKKIPIDELGQMYGSIHCMTNVFYRDPSSGLYLANKGNKK